MSQNEPILNQEICFQLYVASKEIIRLYKPYLDNYQLTYTGFITLLAIEDGITVRQLGEKLFLDSGTLSPLLKKLEKQQYVFRSRSTEDERSVSVSLTSEGKLLLEQLPAISQKICQQLYQKNPSVNYPLLLEQLSLLNTTFLSEDA